jgi:hypothetical protein
MGGVLLAMLDWRGFPVGAGLGARSVSLAGLIAASALIFLVAAVVLRAGEGGELWRELRGRVEGSHPESD